MWNLSTKLLLLVIQRSLVSQYYIELFEVPCLNQPACCNLMRVIDNLLVPDIQSVWLVAQKPIGGAYNLNDIAFQLWYRGFKTSFRDGFSSILTHNGE